MRAAGRSAVAGARGRARPLAPDPGEALREALALQKAGDAAGAAERFAALAQSAPEIADHAAELQIAALLAAGAPESALAAAAEFRVSHPDSWLLVRVLAEQGEARVALGEEPAARQAFEQALAALPAGQAAERARLHGELARSFERSGDAAAAAAEWQTLWTREATSEEARHAEQALARLAAANPALVYRTPAALRERCQRLFEALRNDEAMRACDEALAADPGDRGLLRVRAELCFRMRRYPQAVDAFAALGTGDPEAVFWRARSLARSGRTDEALAVFDRLAAGRDRELAARARFLAGTLHEDADLAAAEASYRKVAESAPLAAQRSAARWRLAWLAWRRGDAASAASAFERFLADEADPAERARGRYWLGRTLARLGKPRGPRAARRARWRGAAQLLRLAGGGAAGRRSA